MHSFEYTLTRNEIPVRVDIVYYKKEVPGKYDGPWEHCYPTEPAEADVDIKTLKGYNVPKALYKHISEKEWEELENKAIEHMSYGDVDY